MGSISFAGVNLNDGSIYKVMGPLAEGGAGPDINRLAYAAREGSGVSYVRYPERQVVIAGRVFGATLADREANLDALMLAFNQGVQALTVGFEDDRFYRARLLGQPKVNRITGNFYFDWEATFLLDTPFAFAQSLETQGPDTLTLTYDGVGSLYSVNFTVPAGGTAPSRPIYTITVPHGSTAGIIELILFNLGTVPGQAIFVDEDLVADSVLVIDCDAMVVTLNDVEIDFGGQFPLLDPRAGIPNLLQIRVQALSAPDLDVKIDWFPRWFA